jgi:hypothetical protein
MGTSASCTVELFALVMMVVLATEMVPVPMGRFVMMSGADRRRILLMSRNWVLRPSRTCKKHC